MNKIITDILKFLEKEINLQKLIADFSNYRRENVQYNLSADRMSKHIKTLQNTYNHQDNFINFGGNNTSSVDQSIFDNGGYSSDYFTDVRYSHMPQNIHHSNSVMNSCDNGMYSSSSFGSNSTFTDYTTDPIYSQMPSNISNINNNN
ncbi:hypothetical protein [Candidatus Tisiphia endosymbiont of Ptychoptera albimana]|uniref:hypothetical protein n=1 Tax=Candidatus Tisiphia endosymbiont of Ptychoptera albimana TaxID=3066260 RepID=UPI00312CACB7